MHFQPILNFRNLHTGRGKLWEGLNKSRGGLDSTCLLRGNVEHGGSYVDFSVLVYTGQDEHHTCPPPHTQVNNFTRFLINWSKKYAKRNWCKAEFPQPWLNNYSKKYELSSHTDKWLTENRHIQHFKYFFSWCLDFTLLINY